MRPILLCAALALSLHAHAADTQRYLFAVLAVRGLLLREGYEAEAEAERLRQLAVALGEQRFTAMQAEIHGVRLGPGEQVRALAVHGSMVYVGGAFTQAGGAPANRVARFDATTQTWASLGSGTANGMNDAVLAITTSGSMVYAGGLFTQAGGAPANQVARFDTTTQTWASLGSGVAGGSAVSALARLGRTVYAGGLFSQAGGATANHIARFDTVDQTWASLGSGADNGVNAPVAGLAATTDGVLYLGGSFDLAFGQVSPGVASYNAEQIFRNGFE